MAAKPKLTAEDLQRDANELGVSVQAMKAVLKVEAPRGGFQDDGQVSILFEPHKFSEFTGGRFDASHPDLSYPVWGTRPYGKFSEQHGKLQRAVELDRDAALRATSWGMPQILGDNWKQAGAKDLQDFINRMSRGEPDQLDMMVNFIRNEKRRFNPTNLQPSPSGMSLLEALKACNWRVFARIYNGPGFAKNQYDKNLAAAYAEALRS